MGRSSTGQSLSLVPERDGRLADGVIVTTRVVARLFGAPVLRVEGEVVLTPARLAPLGATVPSVRARPAADPSQPIIRRLPNSDNAGGRPNRAAIAEAMVLLEQTSDSLRRLADGH